MGCGSGASSITVGPQPVWTNANPLVANFHPMSEPLPSASIRRVRVTLELRQQSSDCNVRPAFQYSDDGETWDSAENFGLDFTSIEGESTSDFVDVTEPKNGPRRGLIRFGVKARNASGGKMNLANVRLALEFD